MHRLKEERTAELNAKAEIANTDFNLLLQEDRIAFYESCEMTQIFLYNNETKETQNYYTLFVFEETAPKDTKDKYLFPKLQKIDNKFKFGVIQKRISIEEAKEQFKNIQQNNKIIFNKDNCDVSTQMVLLPKTFVPMRYGLTEPMLNRDNAYSLSQIPLRGAHGKSTKPASRTT